VARKSSGLEDIFKKTEPGEGGKVETSDLDAGNITATGVGLREGEIAALDAIGARVGELLDTERVARNALIRIAVRRLIVAHRAGEITLEELARHFERPDKPAPKLRL
jgi:hypothetical protein